MGNISKMRHLRPRTVLNYFLLTLFQGFVETAPTISKILRNTVCRTDNKILPFYSPVASRFSLSTIVIFFVLYISTIARTGKHCIIIYRTSFPKIFSWFKKSIFASYCSCFLQIGLKLVQFDYIHFAILLVIRTTKFCHLILLRPLLQVLLQLVLLLQPVLLLGLRLRPWLLLLRRLVLLRFSLIYLLCL